MCLIGVIAWKQGTFRSFADAKDDSKTEKLQKYYQIRFTWPSNKKRTCLKALVLFIFYHLIPTCLIHFATKHIGLVFVSFDTIITAFLPIILGFKL